MGMQLVERTLRTLRLLGASGTSGMTELASRLDIPLPSMHRLLASMEAEGFVVRTPDRRFALGPEALALAAGRRPLDQVIRPYMEELAAQTGATVFVAELVGERAVCTALVPGTGALRLFVRVGQEIPAHAAASARVLLAGLDDARVRALLGTSPQAYMPGTPVTPAAVEHHLELIRTCGYDICENELDPGVMAVSVPIHGKQGIRASLTLAAPATRADGRVAEWVQLLLAASAAVDRELGFGASVPAASPGASVSAR